MLASLGMVVLLVVKINQGRELSIGPEDHVPALSSVAPIGSTTGNVFLTAKADAAVSSISRFYVYFGLIDKLDGSDSGALQSIGENLQAVIWGWGYTLTFLRSLSRRSKVTTPSTLAKSV